MKTAVEQLWQECTAYGRKLDGMTNHAASIVEQAKDDDNPWRWAQGQLGDLEGVLTKVQPVTKQWCSAVRTSSLAALKESQGSVEESITWLDNFKKSIVQATTELEAPLGILVGMHNTMLRKRFVKPKEGKKKPKAKAQKTTA